MHQDACNILNENILWFPAGFRKLGMDQQIMIVQMAMYPIVLTKLSTEYDLATRKYNYFNFEDVGLMNTNCLD